MIRKNKTNVKRKEGDYYFLNSKLLGPYNAYCRSKNITRENRLKKDDLLKVCSAIFKEIGDQLIDRTGGVFIKKFGYFFVFISRGHKARRIGPKPTDLEYNVFKRGEIIRTIFLPQGNNMDLNLWGMDYTFSRRVYEPIKKNVQNKTKEYKGYPFSVRRLLNLSQRNPWVNKEKEENGSK